MSYKQDEVKTIERLLRSGGRIEADVISAFTHDGRACRSPAEAA
jgi:hypothetical protein